MSLFDDEVARAAAHLGEDYDAALWRGWVGRPMRPKPKPKPKLVVNYDNWELALSKSRTVKP